MSSSRYLLASFWVALSCAEQRLDLGRDDAPGAALQRAPDAAVSAGAVRIRSLSLGLAHTCALTDERLSCIGANDFAQTSSDSTSGGTCAPCVQEATHLDEARTADDLRAGGEVTCLLEGDRAACFGRNTFGQLGRGLADENPHAAPADLGLPEVSDVGVGRHHVCVASEGRVWCAGLGHAGQLGLVPEASCAVPNDVAEEEGLAATAPCATELTLVPDLVDIERLVVRRHTTCAVSSSGAVTCFGDTLPLPGSLASPLAPTEIDALGSRDFALGWDHGCLLASGRVECWGDHRRGQLGLGEVPDGCGPDRCNNPVPLIDERGVLAVAAGDGFTCLRVEGGVRCFGIAAEGRLGISSPDDLDTCATGPCSTTPRVVRFEGISELPEGIVVGDHHACALMANGTAACWGNNERAQIARHLNDEDDAITLPSGLYGL